MANAFGTRIRPRIHNDSDLAVAVAIATDFDLYQYQRYAKPDPRLVPGSR